MKVAKRFLEKSYMELIKSYDIPLYLVLAKQNKKTTGEECSGEECHENSWGRFKISPNGFLFEGQSNFLQKYTIVGVKKLRLLIYGLMTKKPINISLRE